MSSSLWANVQWSRVFFSPPLINHHSNIAPCPSITAPPPKVYGSPATLITQRSITFSVRSLISDKTLSRLRNKEVLYLNILKKPNFIYEMSKISWSNTANGQTNVLDQKWLVASVSATQIRERREFNSWHRMYKCNGRLVRSSTVLKKQDSFWKSKTYKHPSKPLISSDIYP
jgi:hypothetical protein